ncbi:hypothetical protein [Mycolicibacterium sp.]|uniref:hypothetical protein n=1 Tax=Mycolicibacterium sp. TaxID=2320850 RepID=UPI003D109B47
MAVSVDVVVGGPVDSYGIFGALVVLAGALLLMGIFALLFGGGAIALIGSTQCKVVLVGRYSPQQIMLWALVAASASGAAGTAAAVRTPSAAGEAVVETA